MGKIKEHRIIGGVECRECCRCKRWLPCTDKYFTPNKRIWDGLVYQCRDCARIYHLEYNQNNPQKIKAYNENSKERQKERYAELTPEQKHKKYLARKEAVKKRRANDPEYDAKIRERENKRLTNWFKTPKGKKSQRETQNRYLEKLRTDPERKKQLEKLKKQRRKYKNRYNKTPKGKEIRANGKHRREARKRGLERNLTNEDWTNIKAHFNDKCAYCGCEEELTRDHFIPLNKGGEFTVYNIVPACFLCNSYKQDNDFFEWYPKFEHYSYLREKEILKFLGYENNENQQLKIFF